MFTNNLRQVFQHLFVSFFISSTVVSSIATVSNLFNGCRTAKHSLILQNGLYYSGSIKQPSSRSPDNRFIRCYSTTMSDSDDPLDAFIDGSCSNKDYISSSSSSSNSNNENVTKDLDIRDSIRISTNDNNDQILRSNEPSNLIRLMNEEISGKNHFRPIEIDNELAKELVTMRGRDLAEALFLSGICLYIYIYIYVYVYICIYIYIYIYMYVMYVCICVYVCICICNFLIIDEI
jgi:hypothetical protein